MPRFSNQIHIDLSSVLAIVKSNRQRRSLLVGFLVTLLLVLWQHRDNIRAPSQLPADVIQGVEGRFLKENPSGGPPNVLPMAPSLPLPGEDKVPMVTVTTFPLSPVSSPQPSEPTAPPVPAVDDLSASYVQAILNLSDTTFPRMTCPDSIGARYDSLRHKPGGKIKYLMALNLYEVAPLLLRLMGTIIEVIKFLGPEHCALSVVEGRSTDHTLEILEGLRPQLAKIGARYFLDTSSIDPLKEGTDRIVGLSALRNMALAPLTEHSDLFDPDTIITFSNDVASCPDDILELLYQHRYQGAAMTCAFDWICDGACFYDVWVSRSMVGNTFFEIPSDVSWAYHDILFWDDPLSRDRFGRFQPLQVYSCWGGMVTLDAKVFVAQKIQFRASRDGECYMGEPMTLAKDMWAYGMGRIAAIPLVNVGYSNEEGEQVKQRKGYVSDHVNTSRPADEPQTDKIEWQTNPPGQLKCLPSFENPSWFLPV